MSNKRGTRLIWVNAGYKYRVKVVDFENRNIIKQINKRPKIIVFKWCTGCLAEMFLLKEPQIFILIGIVLITHKDAIFFESNAS